MEFVRNLIEYFLHLDTHLAELTRDYGGWTYGILALTVFCETGLVVTPILPGDSLLFAAGALAALPGSGLNALYLWPLLFVAVLAGDNVNYFVGKRLGRRIFKDDARILKTKYLLQTEAFYAKHGGKTIVLARFIPIVRTYAPFVAGTGAMRYPRFLAFSVGGALLWITSFLWMGYFFGNIPVVKDNFGLVVIAIILLSVLPAVIEIVKARRLRRSGEVTV
ncbi:MAG TPA: DedA family protein [Longimicrobiaceae bacterium]|nr:DedA family protein [Longimicrobiaceae bacterium]